MDIESHQTELNQFSAPASDPWEFDEYGPTMHHHLPPEEQNHTRLEAYGFNLDVIHEADGILQIHRERGLHPDDEHREDHYPEAEEQLIKEDLATKRAQMNDRD